MKIVCIKWLDASFQNGEITKDEFVPHVYLETVGLLAQEDEKCISVAQDFCQEDKSYRRVEHIPKVNILEIREVEISCIPERIVSIKENCIDEF